MNTYQLKPVSTDHDYRASFPVMRELRPHLSSCEAFAEQARRQSLQGYSLLAAWQGEEVKGLAGYRFQENLIYGRFLYVDDLIATEDSRRFGVGAALINALRGEARIQGCAYFVLDTALENALGQRFYYRQGLLARGMHFCEAL